MRTKPSITKKIASLAGASALAAAALFGVSATTASSSAEAACASLARWSVYNSSCS
ncbi:hypothetical protein [Leifsonia xyli]|uniref:hypothetical protein n=1 Tax=Leifsonia xyli TaxID=1575 RepID=UPI0012DCEE83|nr:hypothetical protein [Leifsonia xyli]